MSLQAFIQQENRVTELFGRTSDLLPTDPENLTREQKQKLADRVACALSPENLTCDGELRGAKLQAKTRMLQKAKADLVAMGVTSKWW